MGSEMCIRDRVVRSAVSEVPAKGRDTMGVVFAKFADDDRIIGLARNTERNLESQGAEAETAEGAEVAEATSEASAEPNQNVEE